MDQSANYLAVTTKLCGAPFYVINKSDGSIKWSYPVSFRCNGVKISDDESKLWFGYDSWSSSVQNVVFNILSLVSVGVIPLNER